MRRCFALAKDCPDPGRLLCHEGDRMCAIEWLRLQRNDRFLELVRCTVADSAEILKGLEPDD